MSKNCTTEKYAHTNVRKTFCNEKHVHTQVWAKPVAMKKMFTQGWAKHFCNEKYVTLSMSKTAPLKSMFTQENRDKKPVPMRSMFTSAWTKRVPNYKRSQTRQRKIKLSDKLHKVTDVNWPHELWSKPVQSRSICFTGKQAHSSTNHYFFISLSGTGIIMSYTWQFP